MQRISQSMMSSMFLQDMHSSLNRLMEIEKQMSSQQMYSKPSDNPSEVARGLTVKSTISGNEQYQRNLDDAVTWLSNTENALGQVTDIVSSVREKTIYCGNGSLSEVDRDAIAKDIRAMRDELLQIANFNVEGRYLMGGLHTSEKPFVKQENGEVIYAGDRNRISFEVEKGLNSPVSLNGRDVLPASYSRKSVKSMEVPLDFKWKGGSEILKISTGGSSARVLLPMRWSDSDNDNSMDATDFDGFPSPGEKIRGYSLDEIADLINSSEGAGKHVYAKVEKDSFSGTQRLDIRSHSGEDFSVASLPWAKETEKGQVLNSAAAGAGWPGSDGTINVELDGVEHSLSFNAPFTLQDVSDSISGIQGIEAGVRSDDSLCLVTKDGSQPFSVTASGSLETLFGTDKVSEPLVQTRDISHMDLSTALGFSTAITSTEMGETDTMDTVADAMNIMFSQGERELNLKISGEADLTLDELAGRIKSAAGEWLQVTVQEDTDRTNGFSSDSEIGTRRLMISTKDCGPLAIFDKEGSWAKELGINTALNTVDLSAEPFPDTAGAGPEIPAKIGVFAGGQMREIKIFQKDVVDPSTGDLDSAALADQIRKQAGPYGIKVEPSNSGNSFALYSVTGEPVRVIDLPYGDPDLKGISSGLAVTMGLQSGITGDWVADTATASGPGTMTVRSEGRELSLSVSTGDDLKSVADKLGELGGSWLDVSICKDGTGQSRLSVSAKDGSPVNLFDTEGDNARAFGINTDVRLEQGGWLSGDGGVLSLSMDGYTHEMDLGGLTDLDDMSELINARFSANDIRSEVVGNPGAEQLVIYSPAGKTVSITPPTGMTSVPAGVTDSSDRSAGGSFGVNGQNIATRSGNDTINGDLFALLDDLATAMEHGADDALTNSYLPELDKSMDDILRARSYCGAMERRYDTAKSRIGENNLAFNELYSSIMDVDMAEAAMEFQTAQTVYQATLATISKTIQPTLVDYLG